MSHEEKLKLQLGVYFLRRANHLYSLKNLYLSAFHFETLLSLAQVIFFLLQQLQVLKHQFLEHLSLNLNFKLLFERLLSLLSLQLPFLILREPALALYSLFAVTRPA